MPLRHQTWKNTRKLKDYGKLARTFKIWNIALFLTAVNFNSNALSVSIWIILTYNRVFFPWNGWNYLQRTRFFMRIVDENLISWWESLIYVSTLFFLRKDVLYIAFSIIWCNKSLLQNVLVLFGNNALD